MPGFGVASGTIIVMPAEAGIQGAGFRRSPE